jgi:NTP pyrophosphatase (non-canonical NTP hydrolase)
MSELDVIHAKLAAFSDARDWGQFHSPKNLAMALSVEVAELMEHFQWLTEAQSSSLPKDAVQAISEEIADVQLYLLLLSQQLNVDVVDAVHKKMQKNEMKYPVDRVKGKAHKYSSYVTDSDE